MPRRHLSVSGWWHSLVEILGALTEVASAEVSGMEAELKLVVVTARRALVWVVVSAILGTFAVGVMLTAAIAGLSLVMPLWGAASSVGGVLLVAVVVTLLRSRSLFAELESPIQVVRRRVDDHVQWWQEEIVRQAQPPSSDRRSLGEREAEDGP